MRRIAAAAILISLVPVLIVGCARRSTVESCADDLGGVWTAAAGARWMVLDNGSSLEIYPLFDDTTPGAEPDFVTAPRVIDLQRTADGLAGDARQRTMQRAATCEALGPVHVTSCTDDALEVSLGELAAPLAFAPCTWPPPMPARHERWRRD